MCTPAKSSQTDFRVRFPNVLAALVSSLLVSACAPLQQVDERPYIKQLALDEAPYFPKCVAIESGSYRERKLTRQMFWRFSDGSTNDAPINDECIVTEP